MLPQNKNLLRIGMPKIYSLHHSVGQALAYGLGCKIDPISLQAGEFAGRVVAVDCSGYFRWLIYHANNHDLVGMPDGSVQIHAWLASRYPVRAIGLDGVQQVPPYGICAGVLEPTDSEPGHILITCGSLTVESYGSGDGHNAGRGGPGSRTLASLGFASRMKFYRFA